MYVHMVILLLGDEGHLSTIGFQGDEQYGGPP